MAGVQSGGELLQGGLMGCRRLAGGRGKGRRERLDGRRDIPGSRTCEERARGWGHWRELGRREEILGGRPV